MYIRASTAIRVCMELSNTSPKPVKDRLLAGGCSAGIGKVEVMLLIKTLFYGPLLLFTILLNEKASGLFCYTCYWEKQNWKCNEAEPVRCKDGEVCITMGKTPIAKGCMESCPNSRGDSTGLLSCEECTTDLCNGPGNRNTDSGVQHHTEISKDGTNYTLHVKTTTFWEARLSCARDGGILATIQSLATQQFLNERFVSNGHVKGIVEYAPPDASPVKLLDSSSAWIGLYHPNTDVSNARSPWIWTDDGSVISSPLCESRIETPYTNWAKGYPIGETQACGYIRHGEGGTWKSGSCGGLLPAYLCEYPVDVIVQSVIRDGHIYTYKTTASKQSNKSLECEAGKVQEEDEPKVTQSFEYLTEHQTNRGCWDDPLNGTWKSVEKSPTRCRPYTSSIICRRALFSNCEETTSAGDAVTDPTLVVTSPSLRESCDEYTKKKSDGLFTFPQTKVQRFSYSEEKCSDGRPRAMMFCNGSPQPVFGNFVQIDCKKDLRTTMTTISETNRSLIRRMQGLHEVTLFGDHLSTQKISSIAEAFAKLSENVSTVSNDSLSNAVAMVSGIRGILTRKKRNGTESQQNTENLNILPHVLESLAQRTGVAQNGSETYEADGMDIEIVTLDYQVVSSGEKVEHTSPDERAVIRIVPDIPLSRSFKSQNMRAVFTTYDNDDLFPTKEENIRVDAVISATVTDGERIYSVPVEFSMQLSTNPNKSANMCERRECRYYNHSDQSWRKDGCHEEPEIDPRNKDIVKCKCDHTTSFAVVVSQHARSSYALDLASTIGLTICIACLSFTIIIFIFTPELRRVSSRFTHTNLCACLAIAYLVFLVGVDATGNRYGCLVVAALIHFFLLAAWGWMAVESLTMYRMFVHTLDRRAATENPRVGAVVYGTSTAIVLVTMSFTVLVQYKDWEHDTGCEDDVWASYIADGYCWLHGKSLYFGFLLFVGITLCFNIVLGAIIIKAITWGRTEVGSSVEEKPAIHVMRALLVSMLLGAAWIFAVPLAVTSDPIVQGVFGWLFAFTTLIQGTYIFYFFCIRRKDVRDSWTGAISRAFRPNGGSKGLGTSGLAPDGSGRSASMLYLPNIGRTKTCSTTASEMTRKTTTSRASSFVSPRRSKGGKMNEGTDEPQTKNTNDIKPVEQHSLDMLDFAGGDVFES